MGESKPRQSLTLILNGIYKIRVLTSGTPVHIGALDTFKSPKHCICGVIRAPSYGNKNACNLYFSTFFWILFQFVSFFVGVSSTCSAPFLVTSTQISTMEFNVWFLKAFQHNILVQSTSGERVDLSRMGFLFCRFLSFRHLYSFASNYSFRFALSYVPLSFFLYRLLCISLRLRLCVCNSFHSAYSDYLWDVFVPLKLKMHLMSAFDRLKMRSVRFKSSAMASMCASVDVYLLYV